MSETRKRYVLKLIGRISILIIAIGIYLYEPSQFEILNGDTFFHSITFFHYLWLIWVIDIIYQIMPIKNMFPVGSMKLFKSRFRPFLDGFNLDALKAYSVSSAKVAYKVMLIWISFISVIGLCYLKGWISKGIMLIIAIFFYVCDLICVLIWCPFRLIMKNRCCTTCRIFNWDHFMMFSPLIFVGGFYCWSLFGLSLLALIVWEVCVLMYPERFWEVSNLALRCSECSDKLCTQYCQKLRK